VFVAFAVLVPILLLNMLIAMMAMTYEQIISRSEKEWKRQVRHCCSLNAQHETFRQLANQRRLRNNDLSPVVFTTPLLCLPFHNPAFSIVYTQYRGGN